MSNECPINYDLVFEGLAKICVPSIDLYKRFDGVYEPSWAPIFYNPEMVENRDITIAILYTIMTQPTRNEKSFVFVDPMAATGVRSIRFVLEVGKQLKKSLHIYMGDISAVAVDIIKHNLRINRINDFSNADLSINLMDANEYVYHLKRNHVVIDYIDVDPFGSPAPYIHSAISSIKRGGIVGITATDVAVLEGKYSNTLLRRYGIRGIKTQISKEIATRALLSFLLRVATIYDRFIEPLVSYQFKHYVRIFIRVLESASKANYYISRCIGKVRYCPSCGYSLFEAIDEKSAQRTCPICGGTMISIEPLWICNLNNKHYVKSAYVNATKMPWLKKTSLNILGILSESEYESPTIRISQLAKKFRINIPSISLVINCLKEHGNEAYRSIFYDDGIITNASIELVIKCINRTSKTGSDSNS
ncbi:MAG: hypothetical protein QXT53_00055 [Ignisphaera sp.]